MSRSRPVAPSIKALVRKSLPAQKGHSLPGPQDIFRTQLPNGIVILVRSNFNSPSAVISGYIQAGSLFESDGKLGLADFVASALMRGTEKHTFEQIYDALESVGATLGFSSGSHSTGFSGRSLVEDLPLLFDLLAESARTPIFPSNELKKLRAQLLTGLSIRAQDTSDMAAMTFDEIVFAGHPYARPDDGYPETIRAITRRDIARFHKRHFGPKGMSIAVVGAVEPQFVVDQVSRVLGDWQNPAQPAHAPLPPLTPLTGITRKHIPIPGKSQADIVIGASGPERRSPEYIAASLANSVLGQFGMMGRIGDVVREQSGLAYYAYSSLSSGLGPGSWDVSAGVNPTNIERAIELIRTELAGFVEKGISTEELQDSQANFIGRLPLSLESNTGVANALLNIERYNLGLDYYQRYEQMVRQATPEEALNAIRRYLHPDRLAIATAGP